MSLLDPTPGEMWDRITILDLKIKAAKERESSVVKLEAERAGLLDQFNVQQRLLADHYSDYAKTYTFELFGLSRPFNSSTTKPERSLEETAKQLLLYKRIVGGINAQLWECEDRVRALSLDNQQERYLLAAVAKDIASLNDARNRTIREINGLFGYGENYSEKKFYKCPSPSTSSTGTESQAQEDSSTGSVNQAAQTG